MAVVVVTLATSRASFLMRRSSLSLEPDSETRARSSTSFVSAGIANGPTYLSGARAWRGGGGSDIAARKGIAVARMRKKKRERNDTTRPQPTKSVPYPPKISGSCDAIVTWSRRQLTAVNVFLLKPHAAAAGFVAPPRTRRPLRERASAPPACAVLQASAHTATANVERTLHILRVG